ncbi:MAG: zinc ribbon domain-containing protein [Clostridia bacterium]|nr:zinc ribbon domain-containing protein [Clostridia bacterium]
MKCQNCGQQISDNPMFCPNCGAPLQYSEPTQHQPISPPMPQQPTQQPDPQTNYQFEHQQPQVINYAPAHKPKLRKKWYEKNWVIILFLIFCFPLGLFLMWKFSNWNKIAKIIVTIAFAIFKIWFWFGDSGTEANGPTPNTTSTTAYLTEATTPVPSTKAPTTKAPTTATTDKNILALTNISNLTVKEAKEILKDLKAVGFDHIDSATINGNQSNADSGASFTVSCNGYSAILIVIERKTDYIISGDVVLYKDGKVVDNINNYTFSDTDKGTFIYYAKEYVLQGLKSPSTAEFPGTILEIGEWKVSRNKDVVTVKSYVDSQNGFGAMVRSTFIVQMSYSDKSCLYLQIDGTTVYGEPQ